MPVLINPEDYLLWLNKKMHDPGQLRALYRPYPAELLRTHKVSDQVNSPRFDGPACIAQFKE